MTYDFPEFIGGALDGLTALGLIEPNYYHESLKTGLYHHYMRMSNGDYFYRGFVWYNEITGI